MTYVTRFNPTTNGDLHLGHVYMVLFNERLAHDSGGKFIVRFEDNQIDTLYSVPADKAQQYASKQHEALVWLGIQMDEVEFQSAMDIEFKEFVAHHGWWMPEYRWPYEYALDPTKGDYLENPGGYKGDWYPYAPYLTFAKVCYDEMDGINMLVRGDDLRSEFALYEHFRELLGLKAIRHYYLPRLTDAQDATVSKFFEARPVLAYRDAGWKANEVIELLGRSALKEPSDGWQLHNVKRYPRLDPAFSLPVGVHDSVSANWADGYIRTD